MTLRQELIEGKLALPGTPRDAEEEAAEAARRAEEEAAEAARLAEEEAARKAERDAVGNSGPVE